MSYLSIAKVQVVGSRTPLVSFCKAAAVSASAGSISVRKLFLMGLPQRLSTGDSSPGLQLSWALPASFTST